MIYWPDKLIPQEMVVNLKSNNKSFESSLNGSELTANFMGDKWHFTLSFSSLDSYETEDIEMAQSFIWSLQGMNGRFKMWPFTKKGGPAKGSPVVNGGSNSGNFLFSKGWQPNRVVLRKGEFIEVNNELKFIKEDVVSDSSGLATMQVIPPLRRVPADETEIITDKPCGIFRLADDDQGDFDYAYKREATINIEVKEVIYYV